jgi:hypothetical protein
VRCAAGDGSGDAARALGTIGTLARALPQSTEASPIERRHVPSITIT